MNDPNIKKYNSKFKLSKIELTGKKINGEFKYTITDCDKSFCDVCDGYSCDLDYFAANNPDKAKIFLHEVYDYMIKKKPHYKGIYSKKIDVIKYALEMCSGHDNHYDFIFRGNKLISVKYDRGK